MPNWNKLEQERENKETQELCEKCETEECECLQKYLDGKEYAQECKDRERRGK